MRGRRRRSRVRRPEPAARGNVARRRRQRRPGAPRTVAVRRRRIRRNARGADGPGRRRRLPAAGGGRNGTAGQSDHPLGERRNRGVGRPGTRRKVSADVDGRLARNGRNGVDSGRNGGLAARSHLLFRPGNRGRGVESKNVFVRFLEGNGIAAPGRRVRFLPQRQGGDGRPLPALRRRVREQSGRSRMEAPEHARFDGSRTHPAIPRTRQERRRPGRGSEPGRPPRPSAGSLRRAQVAGRRRNGGEYQCHPQPPITPPPCLHRHEPTPPPPRR